MYSIHKILISLIKKIEFCNDEYILCVMTIYHDLLKKNGVGLFIDHKDILCTIGELITCTFNRIQEPRKKALKILSKISIYSENGHDIVMDWYLNMYQKIHQEPSRFTHLIAIFRLDNDLKHSILKFIHSLLHFDRKGMMEQELMDLGFYDMVEWMYLKKEKVNEKLKKELERMMKKDIRLEYKVMMYQLLEKKSNSISLLLDMFTDLTEVTEDQLIQIQQIVEDVKHGKSVIGMGGIMNMSGIGESNTLQKNNMVRTSYMGFGEYGVEDEMINTTMVCVAAKKRVKVIKRSRAPTNMGGVGGASLLQKRNALRFQHQSNKNLKSKEEIDKFEKMIHYLKKFGYKVENIFQKDSSILEITLLKSKKKGVL
jgi:hypothetical protein